MDCCTIPQPQIRAFEEFGVVTFDGPFTKLELEAADARVEELHAKGAVKGGALQILDQTLLDLIQHPFLEAAAKQLLHANEVECIAWIAMQKDPQPGSEFRQDYEHQDIRYQQSQLQAVPRQMLVTFLLWLTDVTMDRAPFMYRSGSHRQIAEYVQATAPQEKATCTVAAHFGEALPPLEYSDPQPVIARAGEISAVTTSLIHSGSSNTGTLPRRVMFINFAPKGLPVQFDSSGAEQHREYHLNLRPYFRPERRHLLPS